jgi:hypothetical protein
VKARCGWQRDDLGCDEDEPDSVMGGINLKTKAAWMCGDKQHEKRRKKLLPSGVEIDPPVGSTAEN